MVSIKAVKTLKNGKTSEKSFKSIASAAAWVAKKHETSIKTAASSISSAALGRESRKPKNHVRNTAYGYKWER